MKKIQKAALALAILMILGLMLSYALWAEPVKQTNNQQQPVIFQDTVKASIQ